MLESLIWILLFGFAAGQLVQWLKGPALVGMVFVGILIGPEMGNLISPEVLAIADDLRTIAVMVILMKAGLGLDRAKLQQQRTVPLRLGMLPATCEAIAIAALSMRLFDFDALTGLLLGTVLAAESPAVIVPGMLRLKRLGWGVTKGIPDAILTGSALSDVLLLLVFSLLMAILTGGETAGLTLPWGLAIAPWQRLFLQLIAQIVLGAGVGWLGARLLVSLLSKHQLTHDRGQDLIVAAGATLMMIVAAEKMPVFSGYLAVMGTGFFLGEQDAPLARQLRSGFEALWAIAQIILFVLLGAGIQLNSLQANLWVGLLILGLGTLIGRSLGWYLATLGSNWNWRERLFLLPGNSAKATVQAAIGTIPLAQGVPGGEIILAMSALSILITAPLGAWAIPTFAPKLLTRGKADPTKVNLSQASVLLVLIADPAHAEAALTQTATLARKMEAEVSVLQLMSDPNRAVTQAIALQIQQHLADIRHQHLQAINPTAGDISALTHQVEATEVVIPKTTASSDQSSELKATINLFVRNCPLPAIYLAIDKANDPLSIAEGLSG